MLPLAAVTFFLLLTSAVEVAQSQVQTLLFSISLHPPPMQKPLYSPCRVSRECGDHQFCDTEGRSECRCVSGDSGHDTRHVTSDVSRLPRVPQHVSRGAGPRAAVQPGDLLQAGAQGAEVRHRQGRGQVLQVQGGHQVGWSLD